MNTTTPRTNATVLALALRYLKIEKARVRAYEEEVAEWYRAGDGRPPRWRDEPMEVDGHVHFRSVNYGGKGYTFPHCIHGTSRWTDYDNICGPCEEDWTPYQIALARAHDTWETFRARSVWLRDAPDDLPNELKRALLSWAMREVSIDMGWEDE